MTRKGNGYNIEEIYKEILKKLHIRIALIRILFFAFISISCIANGSASISSVKKPFLFVSVEKTEFGSEENISLNFRIGTISKIPFYIPIPNPNGHLCRISITDKKSGAKILVKYPQGPWENVSYAPFRLSTGSSFDRKINIGKLKPGRYAIQIKYESAPFFLSYGLWTGSVDSNTVDIFVSNPLSDTFKKDKLNNQAFQKYNLNYNARLSFLREITASLSYIPVDRNGDGIPDLWQDVVRQIIVRDNDYNGIPDTWDYFKNGRLFRSGYDTDGDGMPDTFSNH